uniref:Uncharacterized protein n=1 Tax=Knipowitschia caucasica TaxID=637954 RepID=A0AAV2MIT8_KNICA
MEFHHADIPMTRTQPRNQRKRQRQREQKAMLQEASMSHNPTDTDNTESMTGLQDQALTAELLTQTEELKLQLEREQQRNQASQKDLLTQIERLKEEVERNPGEMWAFKSRHRAQREEWMEYVENMHKKDLEAKDRILRSLEKQNAKTHNVQVNEARKTVADDLLHLQNKLNRKDKRAQTLLDIISEKSRQETILRNQVTALQQELQQEQQEKELLRSQVTQLKLSLSEKDAAERHVEQLQTETQKLSTTVDTLTSALDQEKSLTRDAVRKMQEKERETQELKTQVKTLTSALNQEKQATTEAQTSHTGLLEQMEYVQNEHSKELEAKESELTLLKQQKASAFKAQVEEARKAVWAEIADLKVANFEIEEELNVRDKRTQALQDTITQRLEEEKCLKDQVTEPRQALREEKHETEDLWRAVEELQGNHNTKDSPACNREVWEVLKEKLQQQHREQLCAEKQSQLILEQQIQKLSEDLTSSQKYNTALELEIHELQDEVNGLHMKRRRRRSWWCL